MTLLIREDLTDADLAWAAQAFAPRATATAAAPASPARGRSRTLMGLGTLAAVAGLALALSANVGATAAPPAPESLAGGASKAAVAPGWTVQSTVEDHLSADLAGKDVAFSLVSAEATRLDQGGRRFDGSGLAQLDGQETRFVSFSLSVDVDGSVSAFDYGMATGGEVEDVLAINQTASEDAVAVR
ncbi:hypothetical protein [Arenimonas sp.]|uniref:hypothetical protein n=1 Tax=Arenimonas sp. TaxID=1872635 RepID=UPI0035AEB0C2